MESKGASTRKHAKHFKGKKHAYIHVEQLYPETQGKAWNASNELGSRDIYIYIYISTLGKNTVEQLHTFRAHKG